MVSCLINSPNITIIQGDDPKGANRKRCAEVSRRGRRCVPIGSFPMVCSKSVELKGANQRGRAEGTPTGPDGRPNGLQNKSHKKVNIYIAKPKKNVLILTKPMSKVLVSSVFCVLVFTRTCPTSSSINKSVGAIFWFNTCWPSL